jgi:chemotaxis protein MotB
MARKKHHEEHENLERWLVSYADFITLLFAFFTVLYALSQQDKTKYKDAVENVQRAFLAAGGVFSLRGVPFSPFEKTPDKGTVVPTAPEDMGRMAKYEQEEAMDRIAQQLRGLFKQSTGLSLNPGAIEVIRSEKGYRIRLGEYLLFRAGSDKIKKENLPFLYTVGRRLVRMGHSVQVEGHSDNSPTATPEANWQLSVNRAFNVVQFLVQGAKFQPQRISLSGFGDTQPVAENTTVQGRQRNRRVELVVTVNDENEEAYSWENADE